MNNSPKLYFIQNAEGKFYNAKEKTYYSEIINANYEKNKKVTEELITLPRFAGCNVFEFTEQAFMFEMSMATTDAVLAGEYFARKLFKLAYRLPTISQVNKTLYNKCKQSIDALSPFTKMHVGFVKNEEDSTDSLQGDYEEYLHQVSKIEIYQMKDLIQIIKAYHLNRDSILGIANKINKNTKKK